MVLMVFSGDPFIDEAGDLEFQIGESLNNNGTDIQDCGLDGECPYLLFGEGKCSGFISTKLSRLC